MAKPLYHAINCVKKFGGKYQDYLEIHCLMDSSKAGHPQMAHRTIFHSDYGHQLVQRILHKNVIKNSDQQEVPINAVCEFHTIEDLNFVPTLEKYSEDYSENHPIAWKSVGMVESHASQSVKQYGGKLEDYLELHQLMLEPSKTPAGRAIFHSSFGTYIVENILGITLQNSAGRLLATRDVAEQHILRIYRKIPTLSDWLNPINRMWMAGSKKVVFQVVD